MEKMFNLQKDAAERGVLLVAHRGYDFIQTDWLLACGQFLERTGRRHH